MKKRICLLLALLLLAAGCSPEEEQAVQQDSSGLEAGQQEVYGKVISAYGNEITIAVGTLDQSAPAGFGGVGTEEAEGSFPDADRNGGFPGSMDGDGQQPEQGSRSGSNWTERSSGTQGGGSGGAPAQGMSISGGEGGGQIPAGGPSGDLAGMDGGPGGGMGGGIGGSVSLTYDGEEHTCQIPVTATITTGQGEAARTVRFTQIGYKNVVRLVMDDSGQVVSVQILE